MTSSVQTYQRNLSQLKLSLTMKAVRLQLPPVKRKGIVRLSVSDVGGEGEELTHHIFFEFVCCFPAA